MAAVPAGSLARGSRHRYGNNAPNERESWVVNGFIGAHARTRAQRRSNPLAIDLALELLDRLLGTRPIGMHIEQLPERLERRLLLPDLAQDLGKTFQRLVMIGVERERAPQIAQRSLGILAQEVHVSPAIPGLREVGSQIDDG